MDKFRVQADGFYLNDRKFKLLSGAIHYFRIPRETWKRSLYNLKALGFNTVETYIPWNVHEKSEGVFDFGAVKDFVCLAQKLGLYVIVRPSPYICAEWEFGGFPAWLLTKNVRLRSDDPTYLNYVERYYQHLFQVLTPLQVTYGGPIIMMQLENEYGSFGEDKNYLKQIKRLMEKYGANVPLFTADGAWQATLRAGSLLAEDVLSTGNFGSHVSENLAALRAFQRENGKKQPLVCMEFWDGWFDKWGQEPVVRKQAELVETILQVITQSDGINLYMFHGGTNFGFMNGCSARHEHDTPQITSYDYGALLNEQGDPTPAYFELQKRLAALYPELKQQMPKNSQKLAEKTFTLVQKTSLLTSYDQLGKSTQSKYPKSLEELGTGYGYALYRTQIKRDTLKDERFRIIDARDRVHFFIDDEHIKTQYQEEIGADIYAPLLKPEVTLSVLVENMGRVNYGSKLLASTQKKGLKTGLMVDLHFVSGWEQLAFDLSESPKLDYTRPYLPGTPSFYRYTCQLEKTGACHLDLRGFGKGIVLVNGHNLGRFWEIGPQHSLYLPAEFLHLGENELVVFETEGRYQETIAVRERPVCKKVKEEAK